MSDEKTPVDPGHDALSLRRAYRTANQHIVAAALTLAMHGVSGYAPEIKALKAALRAVNRAGGIEMPKPVIHVPKEVVRGYPTASGQRYRKAAP
jgi:hypothetical protein